MDIRYQTADFVTKADFDWAVGEATKKKKADFSRAELLTYDEGLCVQCMHIGRTTMSPPRWSLCTGSWRNRLRSRHKRRPPHHEINLSDARKVAPEKLKTVIRHPVKKV
jgi:hypothetical protein